MSPRAGYLAVAATRLPPGVILDGEAVVYVAADDGRARTSFEAAQSRALSKPRRARELADVGPPIEPVWSTTDRDEALLGYAALEGPGCLRTTTVSPKACLS